MSKGLKNFTIICCATLVAGLCIGFVGFLLGGLQSVSADADGIHIMNTEDRARFDIVDARYESFRNIELDTTNLDITLIPGETYAVKGQNLRQYGGLTAELQGDTLKVRSGKIMEGTWFNFILPFYHDDMYNMKLEITYPANATFSAIALKNNVSDLNISGLQTDSLQVKSDTGGIHLSEVTAGALTIETAIGDCRLDGVYAGVADINMNTGDGQFTDFRSGRLKLKSNTGELAIDGTLLGESEIQADVGDIKLNLAQPKNQLRYKIIATLGEIQVDQRNIEGHHADQDAAGDNALEIESNMGDVTLRFKE
jgi:hypothetical protein